MDDFKIESSYVLTTEEEGLINVTDSTSPKEWEHNRYKSLKEKIKLKHIFEQLDKCAYCRATIEADAYYEPLDHVVPKTIRPQWMFTPKNLVVTCNRCNNLKNDENTLSQGFKDSQEFPNSSNGFKIINQHFDRWGDHLEYQDDIFIVPKPNSKGATTIEICKLYKYNVIVNRVKERMMPNKTALEKSLARLKSLDFQSPESIRIKGELFDAIDHFKDRMIDNPQFTYNNPVSNTGSQVEPT